MTTLLDECSTLSDSDLLSEVGGAAQRERAATARVIALLAEVDHRRLYLGQGCASLFTYCTQVLHLSEHAAYGRIEAARTARRCPIILDLLAEGAITLTTVTLLAPHLTPENSATVLRTSRDKSKREVEQIVATLRPQPDVASSVRRVAVTRALPIAPEAGRSTSPSTDPLRTTPPADSSPPSHDILQPQLPPVVTRPAVIAPLAPDRYKIQCTVSGAIHDKLRRAQDLLRHSVPNGDLSVLLDRALTLLLADLEKAKCATTERPRNACPATTGGRHIPAAVRRAVWRRDGGQCAFVGTTGRCTERGFLEFHHVEPYATGGPPTVENIALRCRAHNLYEAEQYFGDRLPLLARETASTSYA